ncbi:hypothetical protein HNR46_000932 [Haloferula luteola]|uniref:PEP-CTERM protein-sorting domain-containing protein n=1 Tax=Haloferula luteola TaxID=595692 RepID=A0A840V4Z6_9BACT|nr:PEP-CTERM sorting domain-containing protein [Haloferula luteola]MBB5350704.1 hypothetical protein [Haloferula luteola]
MKIASFHHLIPTLSALVFPASAALTVSQGDFESGGLNFAISGAPDFITSDLVASSGQGWYTSANVDKTFQITSGGSGGSGNYAAVTSGGTGTIGNHRGIVYVLEDGQSTTGEVTATIDLLMLPQGGNENFLIKVFGVTDSDAGTPGVQWDGLIDLTGPLGNFDALNLRNLDGSSTITPGYTGSSLTTLASYDAASLGAVAGTSWNSGLSFSFDLGASGYDQVIIGFAIHDSPIAGTLSGIDNLTIVPEPSATFLMLTSATGLLVRRRR